MLKPESGLGLSSYLAAVTLTIMLTVLFAFIIVSFDLQAIMSQWNERRCELPVMVMASWFKPNDNPKSGSEFAQENFDNVRVPVKNMIGKINEGWKIANMVLGSERFTTGHPRNAAVLLNRTRMMAEI